MTYVHLDLREDVICFSSENSPFTRDVGSLPANRTQQMTPRPHPRLMLVSAVLQSQCDFCQVNERGNVIAFIIFGKYSIKSLILQ